MRLGQTTLLRIVSVLRPYTPVADPVCVSISSYFGHVVVLHRFGLRQIGRFGAPLYAREKPIHIVSTYARYSRFERIGWKPWMTVLVQDAPEPRHLKNTLKGPSYISSFELCCCPDADSPTWTLGVKARRGITTSPCILTKTFLRRTKANSKRQATTQGSVFEAYLMSGHPTFLRGR